MGKKNEKFKAVTTQAKSLSEVSPPWNMEKAKTTAFPTDLWLYLT